MENKEDLLKQFTLKELREEVQRREKIIREERNKLIEVDNPRCRSCEFIRLYDMGIVQCYVCCARFYKLHGYWKNYTIKTSDKACDNYKRRDKPEKENIKDYNKKYYFKNVDKSYKDIDEDVSEQEK